jgi:hypothetical protein
MPPTRAPAAAPLLGFTIQARRFGLVFSICASPFAIALIGWRRRSTSKPYRLRGRTWRVGPLRWTRLRESVPGPRR